MVIKKINDKEKVILLWTIDFKWNLSVIKWSFCFMKWILTLKCNSQKKYSMKSFIQGNTSFLHNS